MTKKDEKELLEEFVIQRGAFYFNVDDLSTVHVGFIIHMKSKEILDKIIELFRKHAKTKVSPTTSTRQVNGKERASYRIETHSYIICYRIYKYLDSLELDWENKQYKRFISWGKVLGIVMDDKFRRESSNRLTQDAVKMIKDEKGKGKKGV